MATQISSKVLNYMGVAEPILILKQAHEVAVEKLELLSKAVTGLEKADDSEAVEALEGLFQFFEQELRVHFSQEERALFPALEMVIGRAGPIQAMLDEHRSVWRAIDALEEKTAQLEGVAGDYRKELAGEIGLVANHIVGLLRSHIDKENGMLFSIAEKALSTATMQEIAERMRAVA